MHNLHPVMQSALRGIIAPLPEVSCKPTRHGRINEYEFRGTDAKAVHRAADVRMAAIDPYRSPGVVAQRKDGDEFVVVVRYYTCD